MTTPARQTETAEIREALAEAKKAAQHEASYRIETPHGTVRYEPGYPEKTLYGRLAAALETTMAERDKARSDRDRINDKLGELNAAVLADLPSVETVVAETAAALAQAAQLTTDLAERDATISELRTTLKPFAACWRPYKSALEFTTIRVRVSDLGAAHSLSTKLSYGTQETTHADPA